MVGYCRIQENAHFASDVVAGAAIGWSVTHAVVNRHNAKSDPTAFQLSPYMDGHNTGLMFSKNF
jgi:membrane-associated phospholipid phosphatase